MNFVLMLVDEILFQLSICTAYAVLFLLPRIYHYASLYISAAISTRYFDKPRESITQEDDDMTSRLSTQMTPRASADMMPLIAFR